MEEEEEIEEREEEEEAPQSISASRRTSATEDALSHAGKTKSPKRSSFKFGYGVLEVDLMQNVCSYAH